MRDVIKRNQVRVGGQSFRPSPPEPNGHSAAPAERSVRLIQVDGRVQAIEFTCNCGETSVFEIEYEESSDGGTS